MASMAPPASSGGVWLISSASTTLAKIGPRTKRNSRFPFSFSSSTVVPVMSDGIRSGVNWTREGGAGIWLTLETMSVLARPGTPTRRQWPRVKMAASTCSITSPCPTTTLRSWSSIWVRSAANWFRYSVKRSVDTSGLSARVGGERVL